MNTCISALQHLRPLRGGAQAHLLRATDGNCYVTKFQNNPQHVRVLANEMLASRLGVMLGLPIPQVAVVEVSEWLIEHTLELRIQLAGTQTPCRSGRQLGSLYMGSPGLTLDYLPQELLSRVSNVADFARVLVLDKWTCNAESRVLPEKATQPKVHSHVCRPGILLQCWRMEVSGLSAQRRVRKQLRVRNSDRLGVVRACIIQGGRDELP